MIILKSETLRLNNNFTNQAMGGHFGKQLTFDHLSVLTKRIWLTTNLEFWPLLVAAEREAMKGTGAPADALLAWLITDSRTLSTSFFSWR